MHSFEDRSSIACIRGPLASLRADRSPVLSERIVTRAARAAGERLTALGAALSMLARDGVPLSRRASARQLA